MGWMLRGIAAALCLWAASAAAGLPETPRPRQITVADGLPSNRINAIAQDAEGYLWIGTADGLVRYDGVRYRIWRTEQGLRDNTVWAVHVDASDRIWIGTGHRGLAVLDRGRGVFRYFDGRSDSRIGSDAVWSIASTADGALWFGTGGGGLHRMDRDGRITRYMPRPGDPRSLPDASVGQLAVAPDGTLWIGTKDGVARWTGRDFLRLPPAALAAGTVNGLQVDADGKVWIGTPHGTTVVSPDGVASRPFRGAGVRVFQMLLHDRAGNRWLDTAQGLGLAHADGGEVVDVPLYSSGAQGLVRPAWTSAFEDRSGGLWFAGNTGLWHLPARWSRFTVLPRVAGDPDSLGNAHVRGIAADADGQMWLVGSGGTLDRLDPESGVVEHRVRDIGDGDLPTSVHVDPAGRIWTASYAGIARYEPASGTLRRWRSDDVVDAAPRSERIDFVDAGGGRLWLVPERGALQLRDGDGRVLDRVPMDVAHGFPSGWRVHQAVDMGGELWLAGTQGLLAWDPRDRRFAPPPGAPREEVGGFVRDGDGVWIAGLGWLARYEWNAGRLALRSRRGLAQGFPQLLPSGLVVDANGIVWLTGMRGLLRFDPANGRVRVYGVHDGLPGQEFQDAPVQRPQDGRILAGTPEGLVMFDPARVRPVETPPSLVVDSVTVTRGSRRIALPTAGPVALEAGDRDLRIVARVPSFENVRAHRFRFRLAPEEPRPVEVGADGTRTFSTLDPGAYRLHVRGATADTIWSRELVRDIRVAPPWWRTGPALAVFAALAVALLAFAAASARRRLRARHALQLADQARGFAEQASLAKTRFLATLGHEVRTPMTGVLGMGELLLDTPLDARQRGYADAILRAGRHLVQLVDDALDLARIEAGKLSLQSRPFDPREAADEVAALFGPVAAARGLAFTVEVAPGVPAALEGDRMRLKQVLLNLAGNAVKFTEQGGVSLRLEPMTPQGLRIVVADTGPGLDAAQSARLFERFEQADGAGTAERHGGSGLGLAISRELVLAMGGDIHVDSEPGEGTRFSVELPLPAADTVRSARPRRGAAGADGPPAMRVLLVEDDPVVADVVLGLLRARGHAVSHAAHGLAALAETATARFDAALVDLDLPGMDGLQLARQLRAQGIALPLVAVTARTDAEAEREAAAAGFQGYLRKPVTGAVLAAALAPWAPAPAAGADPAARRDGDGSAIAGRAS